MKNITMLMTMLVFTIASYGQKKANYGETAEDSVNCVKNYSLYIEFYKQKNYKDAFEPWQNTMKYCPKLSKSLYINGSKIYKD
ncbi:MAG: hypothetical protein MRY83_05700, partial [Flavobacteriales bacterium]|nr:hypothetical protein [Flavobacteriales bacterium]